MKYCQQCVLPDTRPNLTLDHEGVCNACRAHATKKNINWKDREKSFRKVVANAQKMASGYDCLIPVSGGKDSTWQVVTCLQYGLKPLTVTWRSPGRNQLGQKNLDNLINLGVDHIDYTINPEVERKFMLAALKKYGSTAIPMHMAIFNIPLRIAVDKQIPLIVYGENSAFEYGGTNEEQTGFKIDDNFLKKFGVTHGTSAKDWISPQLSKTELTPYFGPSIRELDAQGISAIFLGYYFRWDVEMSLKVAQKYGFKADTKGPKTGFYNYADIDDDFISIHHYLKWYKFGFTRLFDNLSLEIRNGRITRMKAIETIKRLGSQRPDDDIRKLCLFLQISENKFNSIIEKFRNKKIWTKKGHRWKINDFIIDGYFEEGNRGN